MEITSKVIERYRGKSLPQLLKLAEKHFNAYIRARDSQDGYFKCISCGQYKSNDTLQAGHYLSAGHNGVVRFNEDNVHGQCVHCNMYLSANLIKYRQRLIEKIGIERVELLERLAKQSGHKWDRFGLIYTIEIYKDKIKEL